MLFPSKWFKFCQYVLSEAIARLVCWTDHTDLGQERVLARISEIYVFLAVKIRIHPSASCMTAFLIKAFVLEIEKSEYVSWDKVFGLKMRMVPQEHP